MFITGLRRYLQVRATKKKGMDFKKTLAVLLNDFVLVLFHFISEVVCD